MRRIFFWLSIIVCVQKGIAQDTSINGHQYRQPLTFTAQEDHDNMMKQLGRPWGGSALCAPRLTFISYGVPEQGDARWLDHQGSYMAAVAAGPVFRLLGAKDLGVSADYRMEKMPPVNVGLLDGELAWRQHNGGHTDAPNVKYFLEWADKFMRKIN